MCMLWRGACAMGGRAAVPTRVRDCGRACARARACACACATRTGEVWLARDGLPRHELLLIEAAEARRHVHRRADAVLVEAVAAPRAAEPDAADALQRAGAQLRLRLDGLRGHSARRRVALRLRVDAEQPDEVGHGASARDGRLLL